MGTKTGSRSENLSGKKVHPILFFKQINNIQQRKEKVAKRKENQLHTHSLLINLVNKLVQI